MFASKALRRKRRTRLVTVLAWLLMESARTTRIIVMGTSSLLDHVVIKMTIYHLLFQCVYLRQVRRRCQQAVLPDAAER